MSFQDFKDRYAQYKNCNVSELAQMPEHRYALQTRERGIGYVSLLQRLLSTGIDKKYVLDIGCAYGGICIELAKAGAISAGVEVVPSYIDLARHNALNDIDLNLYIGDITLRSTMVDVGAQLKGKVDIFIINHVLEHIYDTEGLMESIDFLGNQESIMVFDVPNGFSIQSYIAEGHTGTFGVSLADPDCWHYFGNPRARIYYRRLSYYSAIFAARGFKISLVRASILDRSEMIETLLQSIQNGRKKSELSIAPKHILAEAMGRFESEVSYDIINLSDNELDLKYFHYFWKGIAYRQSYILKHEYVHNIPSVIWNKI